MSSLNRISTLVNSQLPEFIRSDYPVFVEFLEKYYEFLEQPGNPTYEIKTFSNNHNIDLTRESLLKYFREKILPSFPEESELSTERIIKASRDFYAKKGTSDSFKFLFHVLYDKDIEIFFPKLRILRASDGKWVLPQAFRLIAPENSTLDLSLLRGRKGIGSVSRSTCVIERAYYTRDLSSGQQIYEVYVSGVTRPFVNGEELEVDYVSGTTTLTFSHTIIGSLSNIKINPRRRGRRYKVGDPVVINGGLDPDLSGTSKQKAIATVKTVTTASIDSTTIVRRGYGFRVNPNSYIDVITTNPLTGEADGTGDGSAANLIVTSIDTTSNITVNLGLDAIIYSANLTINNNHYDLTNTSPELTFNAASSGNTQTAINIANFSEISTTNDYYNSCIIRIISGTGSNGSGSNINAAVIADFTGANSVVNLNANTSLIGTVNVSGIDVVGNTSHPNVTFFTEGAEGFYTYLTAGKTIEVNGEIRTIATVTNNYHLTVTSAFTNPATNKKINANSTLTVAPDETSVLQITSGLDTFLYSAMSFEQMNVNPILTVRIVSGGSNFGSEPPATLNVVSLYESDYSSEGFQTLNPGQVTNYDPDAATVVLSFTGASTQNDWYNGRRLKLGTQFRTITDYDGATKTAYLNRKFETDITSGSILTKTLRIDNRPGILGMGIVANVEILNGGSGYVPGETLNFSESGVGAAATVATVGGGGIITGISISNRGEGYPKAPVITVNSAGGSGANLKAYLVGDGEDITATATTLGEIIDFNLSSRGAGYIGTPNVSLKIYDLKLSSNSNTVNVTAITENDVVYQGTDLANATFRATVDQQLSSNTIIRVFNYSGTPNVANNPLRLARANLSGAFVNVHTTGINLESTTINGFAYPRTYGNGKAKANAEFLNGLIRYDGFYLNTDGFPSSDKRLQDSERYHNFSYELVSEESYDHYAKTILDVAHPAGTKLLPTHVIPENYTATLPRILTPSGVANLNVHTMIIATNTLIGNCSVGSESNNVTGASENFDTLANVGDLIVINSANTYRSFVKTITSIANNNSLNIESSCVFVGEGKAKITNGSSVIVIAGNTNSISTFISTSDKIRINVDGTVLTKTISSISGNSITLNSNTGITNTTNLTIDTSNPMNYGKATVPALVYQVIPDFSSVEYKIIRTS